MLKKSTGNMYPWVTHTKSYLRGECPHKCSYCYVQAMARRFPGMKSRYSGPITVDLEELAENLGAGRTIFVEHLSDLFAQDVPYRITYRVLEHCRFYDRNTYVFQSKNPRRIFDFIGHLPEKSIIGTTIETNRFLPEIMRRVPSPRERLDAMRHVIEYGRGRRDFRYFVTVEPLLECDPETLAIWLANLKPDWVNIGADSKGHGLPEPSPIDVRILLDTLQNADIEIRRKSNLGRLLTSRPCSTCSHYTDEPMRQMCDGHRSSKTPDRGVCLNGELTVLATHTCPKWSAK